MAERTPSQNRKSLILATLAGLSLFVFLGLLSLPRLTSTDWATDKIKQAINARVDGRLDFDDLSVSWLNGINCRGITYKNPALGILVNIADVSTAKGLVGLAADYRQLGAVTVKDPKVYVNLKRQPHVDSTDSNSPAGPQEQKETGQVTNNGEAPRTTSFPEIEGQLDISGGALIAVLPDTKERTVIKDLEFRLKIAGQQNPLDYQVAFQSGDGTGQVKGTGSITLPSGDIAAVEKIQSQATLAIDGWEVTDLLAILAATSDSPSGSGLINGQFDISGNTGSGLDIKGNLTGERITLRGGPLKTDTPSLDKIAVDLDARKTSTTLTINQLSLQSPLATGKASGTFSADNHREMVGEAVVDLAQLFIQLPATLSLKQGMKILTGQIDLKAQLTASEATTFFDGTAKVDKVQGIADNRKISLDKPINIAASGEQGPAGMRLENFTVQSSFVNGSGRGDMNQMVVNLTADIGAALQEFNKFIDTRGWKSTGKMALDLRVDSKTETLRAVSGDIAIENFILQQKGNVIAPRSEFKAKLVSDLRLNSVNRPEEMLGTSLNFQSWLGSGAVTVSNFMPPSDLAGARVNGLKFSGGLALDRLTTLLQTLEVLPQDTRFTGRADIDARLSANNDRLDCEETTMSFSNFSFEKAGQKTAPEDIHLTTRGAADLKGKTVLLKPLEISTAAGHINLPELAVTDWSQMDNGILSHGSIDVDLGALAILLGNFLALPDGAALAGKGAVDLNIDLTGKKQRTIKLNSTVKNLSISVKDRQPLVEDSMQLALALNGDAQGQTFILDNLDLRTAPVSMQAKGKVETEKKERILTSKGSITVNLPAVSGYLKSLADLELEMQGNAARPFTLDARTTNGQWIDLARKTDFTTSFFADSIRGFGMLVESLEVPIRLAKGHGQADIQGTVNRGQMSVSPNVNFTVEPAEVTLPENSTLLTGVGLTADMSNDLLGHLHPLFRGASISHGTVDLAMHNFLWPLGAAARKDAVFAGALAFNDVKLEAGTFLGPLLAVMKIEEQEITIRNQPMEFVAENERVRCSPLEIDINGYALTLSGTIGFDKSLDYVAMVPVTSRMVDDDIYKYLEGTSITVPIGGTVTHPAISKKIVETALKDLAVQAGKKQLTEQAGKLLQKLFQ